MFICTFDFTGYVAYCIVVVIRSRRMDRDSFYLLELSDGYEFETVGMFGCGLKRAEVCGNADIKCCRNSVRSLPFVCPHCQSWDTVTIIVVTNCLRHM